MKNSTSDNIISLLKQHGQLRAHDIIQHLRLSNVAVHRQLKKLVEQNKIAKIGKPPIVFYRLSEEEDTLQLKTTKEQHQLLEKYYLYINPSGQIQSGAKGFAKWLQTKGFQSQASVQLQAYQAQRLKANQSFTSGGLINATKKYQDTFSPHYLDKLYYGDFYTILQFGKTRLGQLVLHAKNSQDNKLIQQIYQDQKASIKSLVTKKKISAVAFVPHSIPRKLPFLKAFANHFRSDFALPHIKFTKAYSGEILIPQKSLAILKERIENATNTIHLMAGLPQGQRVLIIDDAVGSAATMHQVAKTLKQSGATKVFGYAVVGSMKGFQVISEI